MVAKSLEIDKLSKNEKGEQWYCLGNMYWIPEYKEFYRWISTEMREQYISEDEFPHDYFMFLTEEAEKTFLSKWGKYIVDCSEIIQ